MSRYRRQTPAADVAGVDEAGRGPLAGPVVVAAVVLDPARRINGLDDSKQLTSERREVLYARIVERAIAYSVQVIDVEAIDRINIFQATMLGMRQALCALQTVPRLAIIDGNHLPRELPCTATPLVDGDALEPAISAASILAKVSRDRLLVELHGRYPQYGFASHKGYSTPEHLAALRKHGPCPQHRRSFAPVRACEQAPLFD